MAAGAPKASCKVISVIVAFGVLAFIFAAIAESKRSKALQLRPVTLDGTPHCVWSESRTASSLGFTAMFFLAVSVVTANVFGGCVCCGSDIKYQRGQHRAFAVIFLALTWTMWAMAEIALLLGALLNSYHETLRPKPTDLTDDIRCPTLRGGTFAMAAVFSLITATFATVFYTQAMRAAYDAWASQGIQMSTYPAAYPAYSYNEPLQFTIPSHSPAFPPHGELPPLR